ncbi:type III-A CRISPR-associated protein Cas10/Csm1 [Geitlerinema splendidum]|nr:type III-A CRISPR-associated protein Cas10/Csm1 [Geitlerinema splendidum]
MKSQDVALRTMQESIAVLAKWTGVSLPQLKSLEPEQQQAVDKAKSYLNWSEKQEPQPLRLLFDFVCFPQDGKEQTEPDNYCPVGAIADTDPSIPYPVQEKPDLTRYKEVVKSELKKLNPEDWENLSLLTLFIEKYGSCLSFGESNISLIDMTRSTAAVAAALTDNPETEQITLIAGDLSGIQNFIYTISSDGALKSLRARSFYLELVAEEIVQQLLEALSLPRTSVIYAGGGNLYILSPKTDETKRTVKEVQDIFNKWLYDNFQGKIFLALACYFFPVTQVATTDFTENWNEAIKEVNKQKSKKFIDCINDLLKCKTSYEQRCRVCHRDDTTDLAPLNRQEIDSPDACPMCREMFQLGGKLLKIESIIRSKEEKIEGIDTDPLTFSFDTGNIYYHVLDRWKQKQVIKDAETVLLVNDWTIEHYQFRHFRKVAPLFLGNYAKKSEKEPGQIMRAEELAGKSEGIKRIGYLRMDVDNLGKIFAEGLKKKTIQNLPRIAELSRLMTYFFKVHLNQIAKDRQKYFVEPLKNVEKLTNQCRDRLIFIYAGGDDLFISGSWNEVVDFAFDIYQSFRAYTGYNSDITISGGISIDDVKFPLYQSAELSGKAEELAKGNGKDSLGIFGTAFKWKQWLGATENQTVQELIDELDEKTQNHLDIKDKPEWLGVLPFVRLLYTELQGNYSRSFVRNLLITAELQEQAIKEKQNKIDEIVKKQQNNQHNDEIKKLEYEREEIRYYLHLPKVAYTLARLPDRLRKEKSFKPIFTSLKNPYNAPYFRAIATWIELLTRKESHDSNND